MADHVAVYSYMIHDLVTNRPICNVPLQGAKYSKVLNDSGQASGKFQVESRDQGRRMVEDPYDATTPGRRSLVIYRDELPVWAGIIWTRKYDSTSGMVDIGCGDFWSYFDHRKVLPVLGMPINPTYDIAGAKVIYPNTEQNQIARNLVALAQTSTGGNIGIVSDASTSLINRDREYDGYSLIDTGTALRNLASVIDGPDMAFDVGGPDANGLPIRQFRQGVPRLGQSGSAWVWELGGNLVSYNWPSDAARYASRAFALGEGTVEGTMIAVSEDTSRYSQGFPLMEVETSYPTVSDVSTLQAHADADQRNSRLPVVLPTLIVRGDRSPVVGEWGLGDDARVIIDDDFMVYGVDTSMRIVKAEVTPGEDLETVALTMAPLLDDVA